MVLPEICPDQHHHKGKHAEEPVGPRNRLKKSHQIIKPAAAIIGPHHLEHERGHGTGLIHPGTVMSSHCTATAQRRARDASTARAAEPRWRPSDDPRRRGLAQEESGAESCMGGSRRTGE